VPVHDTLKLVRLSRERRRLHRPLDTRHRGSGRVKIGFLPDAALLPGPLAVMSKSGTLSYEICYRLGQRGIGQSLWIGVSGDAVRVRASPISYRFSSPS
jgi:succinyl-CoA synthetase alpha subunit